MLFRSEKYRPQTLADYVGNEQVKETIQQYLDTHDIPHLLFYGKAGTGKTTLAKLIVNKRLNTYRLVFTFDAHNKITVRNAALVTGDICATNYANAEAEIAKQINNAKAVLRTDNIEFV